MVYSNINNIRKRFGIFKIYFIQRRFRNPRHFLSPPNNFFVDKVMVNLVKSFSLKTKGPASGQLFCKGRFAKWVFVTADKKMRRGGGSEDLQTSLVEVSYTSAANKGFVRTTGSVPVHLSIIFDYTDYRLGGTVLRKGTGTGFACPMPAAAISVDFKSAASRHVLHLYTPHYEIIFSITLVYFSKSSCL